MKRNVPSLGTYVKQHTITILHNLSAFALYLINRRFIPLIVRTLFFLFQSYVYLIYFFQKFFQEMEDLLKTLPAGEIQYQSSHSKQALAKLSDKFGASAVCLLKGMRRDLIFVCS
jgi:hypothetical protein